MQEFTIRTSTWNQPGSVWETGSLLFFLKYVFILYLLLAALGLIAVHRLSLVTAREGYSLVAVCMLLVAMISLVSEHRLQGVWFLAVAAWLSCPMTSGIFPDQGSNLCPLHLQVDS